MFWTEPLTKNRNYLTVYLAWKKDITQWSSRNKGVTGYINQMNRKLFDREKHLKVSEILKKGKKTGFQIHCDLCCAATGVTYSAGVPKVQLAYVMLLKISRCRMRQCRCCIVSERPSTENRQAMARLTFMWLYSPCLNMHLEWSDPDLFFFFTCMVLCDNPDLCSEHNLMSLIFLVKCHYRYLKAIQSLNVAV